MAAAAVRIVVMNVVGLFVMMMAVAREAAFSDAAVRMQHPPVREVRVVVVMTVDRKRAGGPAAEEFEIFRTLAHTCGVPRQRHGR